jgi:hypothetical protein
VSYSFTEIDSGFPGGIQLSFRISQQNFIPVVKIKPAEISAHAARGELIKNAELLNKLSCSQPYTTKNT